MRIAVTGGAGFVGANVSLGLASRHPDWDIVALDNLRRRGAELNLSRLRAAGVSFEHCDIRVSQDLTSICRDPVDALLECSAEPSVLAGVDGDPDYLVQTNLIGAYHCLELARRNGSFLVFLSTSRVYPVAGLEALALEETDTRFELAREQPIAGASARGVSEAFPLQGPRTLYGTTKLSAELLIEEYRAVYGLRAVINRCGVIAGPWQFGKVDQGVFTYWMLAHYLGRPLRYIGFGGSGKQVRDLLHVADLVDLVDEQILDSSRWDGVTANLGGGRECSLSLLETTALCREISGRETEVCAGDLSRPGDVPLYISDCARLFELTRWRPSRTPRQILEDIHTWLAENAGEVTRAL